MSDLSYEDEDLGDRIRRIAADLTQEDGELSSPPPVVWQSIEASLRGHRPDGGQMIEGRFRRVSLPAMAIAAVVMAVAAIGAVLLGEGDDARLVSEVAIVNDGLPVENPESGRAELLDVDGRLVLDVDVPDLPDADGFYELWVIDTEVAGMQSLGIVTGDGRFPLPDGLDPADFPVIDISVEPADGDPTHSGRSIWRGVLEV